MKAIGACDYGTIFTSLLSLLIVTGLAESKKLDLEEFCAKQCIKLKAIREIKKLRAQLLTKGKFHLNLFSSRFDDK